MKFKFYYFLLIIYTLFTSCSNEDDIFDLNTRFYSDVHKSASARDLLGTWAIFNIEFNGKFSPVPVNYQDCGRDYLVFLENGIYKEYVYQNSDCTYISNTLNWSLENGVIILSNQLNQSEELAVTKLTNNELVFKTRFDVDSDGNLDILKAFLKPYTPIEIDLISDTFARNQAIEYKNILSYTWDVYTGNQEFIAYEIYRSSGTNCSKSNAILIETILDVNTAIFTDLLPPNVERLCYFLRIKIKDNVLGESDLQTLDTYTLEATPVNLNVPQVINNTIHLNWEKSEMPYFLYYEISYSNFAPNISGFGEQNIDVIKITDKNVTSFIDQNPPYLEKPYYKINVYDIFGNKTYDSYDNYTVTREVDYKRDEIFNMNSVLSYAINPNKPIIYFFGYESNESNAIKIHRFNYETNKTEAISDISPNTYTNLPIETFTSNYGEEIFLENGGELQVYNANTLKFKYNLKPNTIGSIHDFMFTTSGFWTFTDSNHIYTYSRNNGNLTLINKKPHFTGFQPNNNYSIFEIKNNQLLVGHKNESNSILYNINSNGFLSEVKTVAINISENEKRNANYNAAANFIINFNEKQLFSTNNFSALASFNQPNFASGVSIDGQNIYGSNNNPNWSVNDDGQQKKEAIIYNRNTQQIQNFMTKGYPHIIFENYKGEIVSISSGMRRENLKNNINNKADIFLEIIR
ncbi:lipocalin family protein [Polaribacter glomeratus]|uniref:Lipocalin-like domain-containing protein n=1 Tax=Polaribacter glomeratus TaxID=102 RepID=A0A2S7WVW2_9FLAO|nr:lipocalin family protein [Polaribacter glomeratus]PQJ81698.1 hypothetical protein BTO16_03555 [Polaribacter glomeratus]TXD66376.1 hypothetical protein ESX12_06220 [Polaribacter glomeratus]